MEAEEINGVTIVRCRVGTPKGVVKCWILHDGPTTLIVDTGQDARDADAIRRALASLGRSLAQVDACILTHRHGDHVGGLASLLAERTMPVFVPAADRERAEAATGVRMQELPLGPLKWIPDIEVIPMPGHTPGTVSLYWHSRRTLIASDALFSAGRHLITSPTYLCDDAALALQSVARLVERDLPIEAVLVGHGEDVFEDGKTRIRRILETRRDNNG